MKKRQQPPKRKLVRYGVYLPIELRRDLLKVAIDQGISATKLVERLIKDYLMSTKRKSSKR